MLDKAPSLTGNILSYRRKSFALGKLRRVEVVRSAAVPPPLEFPIPRAALPVLLAPPVAFLAKGLVEQDWIGATFFGAFLILGGLALYEDARNRFDVLISHGTSDFEVLGPLPRHLAVKLAQQLDQFRN